MTSLEVPIYKRFYVGMSKISKKKGGDWGWVGRGVEKGEVKYKWGRLTPSAHYGSWLPAIYHLSLLILLSSNPLFTNELFWLSKRKLQIYPLWLQDMLRIGVNSHNLGQEPIHNNGPLERNFTPEKTKLALTN